MLMAVVKKCQFPKLLKPFFKIHCILKKLLRLPSEFPFLNKVTLASHVIRIEKVYFTYTLLAYSVTRFIWEELWGRE